MVIQKTKPKTALIVIIAVVAAAVLCIASYFIFCSIRLKIAIKNLDVNSEMTVIHLMSLDGHNPDTVQLIAGKYMDNKQYTPAAKLLLYSIQYLSPENSEQRSLLADCYIHLGANDSFINQLESVTFQIDNFETTTRFEGNSYGISNGVYTAFCGGFAKAKISNVLALSLSACPSGVYVLDSVDKRLKLLSEEGLTLKIISDTRMSEFIYCNDKLYYINENNMPFSGDKMIALSDGQIATTLRCENGRAVCTVYDSNFNKIKDLVLE